MQSLGKRHHVRARESEDTHVCDDRVAIMAGNEVLHLRRRRILQPVSTDEVVRQVVFRGVRRRAVNGSALPAAGTVRFCHRCCPGAVWANSRLNGEDLVVLYPVMQSRGTDIGLGIAGGKKACRRFSRSRSRQRLGIGSSRPKCTADRMASCTVSKVRTWQIGVSLGPTPEGSTSGVPYLLTQYLRERCFRSGQKYNDRERHGYL